MNRKQANQKIMNYLQTKFTENPDLRFKQLLIVSNIIKDTHNNFNEESVTTLKRIGKDKTEVTACKNDSNILFTCNCGSSEHQIIAKIIDGYIYFEIHLNYNLSFLQRFVTGIKYIFGYNCKYGHWDEFIMDPRDADKLQSIVNYLRFL